MTTEESLRRKINTCKDLESVVKTMKALSAVSIRQYEKAVESLRDYQHTLEMGLQIILKNSQEKPLPPSSSLEAVGIVVFGSDQGMCGQFNEQIAEYTLDQIQDFLSDKIKLLAVGMRVIPPLEAAGLKVDQLLTIPGAISGITPLIQTIILKIEQWQNEDNINRLILFHNQPKGASSYHPIAKQILPLDQEWLNNLKSAVWPTRMLPQFTLDSAQLFSALIGQYFFVSLYQACAESLSAECNSRLASMQIAEKNINERIEELNRQYQQERQTAITSELLDIVSGFEALNDHG